MQPEGFYFHVACVTSHVRYPVWSVSLSFKLGSYLFMLLGTKQVQSLFGIWISPIMI